MGKMGKFSASDLVKFQKQMKEIQQAGKMDAFVEECAKDLAARLLREVKMRTPVGHVPEDIYKNKKTTVEAIGASGKKKKFLSKEASIYQQYWAGYQGGTLRKGWTIGEIQKEGGVYRVEVINPVEYASYVEYGHRQKPGKYVPALGKQLKQGWVQGKFMLTISEQELQTIAPKMLEARIKKYLEGYMK